jgi:hypothetical protein
MNQATAANLWKGSNRVSRLWEELSAMIVSPDPIAEHSPFGWVDLSPAPQHVHERAPEAVHSFLLEPVEMDSPVSGSEQKEPAELPLLEKAGFESLRLIRHALEILTAPSEEEPAADTRQEPHPETPPTGQLQWGETTVYDPFQASSTLGPVYIKVSSEPEPQPGSTIDTRRIAYGLKIPSRPLHKQPIPLRLMFCLRSWLHMISRGSYGPSPR